MLLTDQDNCLVLIQRQMSDSINGLRPSDIDSDLTTACFPSSTCLAAAWDAELLGRMGEELAHQARLKGAQVVLGPTINMHRDPRGGRNFECFSEDPLLAGQLAGAIVGGIQRHGVGACPKHFVCNDSETLRHYYDVAESPGGRTLREIYLAAWQHLLRTSDPVAVMLAYALPSSPLLSSPPLPSFRVTNMMESSVADTRRQIQQG